MRSSVTSFAVAALASTAFLATAHAQASGPQLSCVNDAPNPYTLVTGWANTPRPWSHPLAVDVDAHDNLWVFDRCEEAGCAASNASPVFQLSPSGKTIRNFGAALFVFPHGIAADKDGGVWAVDGDVKDGKGNQVIKLGPDGKVVVRLGAAGQGTGSKALDTFDQPTGVAIARNGDVFVSEGHTPGFGNSRIVKFDKHGTFIKTFATLGSGHGQLRGPHAIALDSRDRLFVADRHNSRVVIFDRDGRFVAAWKQFGRPSGIAVKHDVLYTIDSQSSDDPKSPNYNPGCKMGIRVGSVKNGRVTAFVPPPVADKALQPPEGITVDSRGVIYAAAQQQSDVKKYVRQAR